MFDETLRVCASELLKAGLMLPALEHCLKCSHLFNLLDSSGSIGVTERTAYILRVPAAGTSRLKTNAWSQTPLRP